MLFHTLETLCWIFEFTKRRQRGRESMSFSPFLKLLGSHNERREQKKARNSPVYLARNVAVNLSITASPLPLDVNPILSARSHGGKLEASNG